jgi:predicted RNase H-like HicB family nuclease
MSQSATALNLRSFKMTMVLESLASGQFSASLLEFPTCRTKAETKELAISQIRQDAIDLMKRVEFLPLEIFPDAIDTPDDSWLQYAGMFENDPDFAEIAAAIRAEREVDDDSEVDPSVYMR